MEAPPEVFPGLRHASDFRDCVVARVQTRAGEQLIKYEGIAGGSGIDRDFFSTQVRGSFDAGRGDQTQKAVVAAEESKKVRLRADRSFAVALDVSNHIVEGRHGDLKASGCEFAHLLKGAGRRLNFQLKIVTSEETFLAPGKIGR